MKKLILIVTTVVDYLEPDSPYRTAANATQALSNGLIGFRTDIGTHVAHTEMKTPTT